MPLPTPLALSPALYSLLADVVLFLHMSFALFIVAGFVLIWMGYFAGWRFVGNRWFRGAHALAMGIVAAESVLGIFCPLTTWEFELRRLAGQSSYGDQTFMSYWAERLFYHDLSAATFLAIYVSFFVVIVLTFVLVPVRWRGDHVDHGGRSGS